MQAHFFCDICMAGPRRGPLILPPETADRPRVQPVLLILKSFIGLGAVVLAAGIVLSFMPGLALLAVPGLASTSPYCTVWQGIRETGVKTQQEEIAKEIREGTRLLKEENGLKLWRTPLGDFWVSGTSDKILPTLLAQQERHIYGDASTGGVRPGDVVIDAGAHVGTFAKKALKDGAKLVVAIEPAPAALECFRRNLREEIAAGRVILVPEGIWDREDRLELFDNGNGNAGDSFITRGEGAGAVKGIRVRPIDSMLADLKLERVDLIKADVKGATEKGLLGATATIQRWKPRIVLSTEEPPENPGTLTKLVQKLEPSYRLRPGPCVYDGTEIRSETVFYSASR